MPYRLDDEILTSRRRQRMAVLAGRLRFQLELMNQLDRDNASSDIVAMANLLVLLTDEVLAELEPPRVRAVESDSTLVGDYPD